MSYTRRPQVLTGFPACAKPITPSNTMALKDWSDSNRSMTVYVGGGGDVNCIPAGNDGNSVTFAVPAGGLVPVEVTHVLQTGTTASRLVGLF